MHIDRARSLKVIHFAQIKSPFTISCCDLGYRNQKHATYSILSVKCDNGKPNSHIFRLRIRFVVEVMPSSRHRQVKTVLSCPCGWCDRIGDKSKLFSVVVNIFETEQFCPVLSAVWTRLQTSPSCKLETGSRQDKTLFTPHFETGQNSCEMSVADSLDLLPILFTDTDQTRQCCLVRVGGVN